MREAVAIALQLLALFTLCGSTRHTNIPPIDDSDYSYESGYYAPGSARVDYEYEYEAEIFPMFPLCSDERLNELVANLLRECANISTDPLRMPMERMRILYECGEPGIELFTECYEMEVYDSFSACVHRQ